MDVPTGVTQEEGNTGFSIHLLSAVLALIFLARRTSCAVQSGEFIPDISTRHVAVIID